MLYVVCPHCGSQFHAILPDPDHPLLFDHRGKPVEHQTIQGNSGITPPERITNGHYL